jgi:hypothetical protein
MADVSRLITCGRGERWVEEGVLRKYIEKKQK